MKDWLTATHVSLLDKPDPAVAIGYATIRLPALTRCFDDRRLVIENNAAERALSFVALGRKNYLFCYSDTGVERAASVNSLIGTAKVNDLNSKTYLRDVIGRMAHHPANRLNDLGP